MSLPDAPARKMGRLPLLRALALAARHLETLLDERLRPLGLSSSDAWVLLLLLEVREIRTTALALTVGVTFSTMTETADRLERAGLLVRQRDSLDRRAVTLRLSPLGHRQALTASRRLAAVERMISRGVSQKHREGFRRVLAAVFAPWKA